MICKSVALRIAVVALHLAVPSTMFAQAWVPAKGEGSLSVTYQKVDVQDHFSAAGETEHRGRIHTHNVITSLEYGLTNKLALDVDLAYVASRFDGPGLRLHGPGDDGFYHPTFSDAHVSLRYNVATKPIVVTPFIGFTIPTHDYAVQGHSAVGRGFHELLVGVNVGRQLGPVMPNGYAHLRYSYAILKDFAGFHLNHSNADWELGWSANKLIALRFLGAWQRTHGGLDFPAGRRLTAAEFDIHDRVAKADYVQVGGGVTFSLNRSFDVHTAYVRTVSARNTHGDAGIILGVTWRFSKGSSFGRIAANTSLSKPLGLGQTIF
ncbi:MAG: hypothetical protein M3539_07340 [Acidobacteriota bacterium]|nr:hypothetical protein [Acidobacteriota bacterium]